MTDMKTPRHAMPSRPGDVRNRDFEEVALGYSEETAIAEAQRCLNCRNKPCTEGCPVKIDIPAFIAKTAEGDFEGAYRVIRLSSSLPAVCGRVCPQETQCEQRCVRGIRSESVAIGQLERFVADRHNASGKNTIEKPQSNGHRVAIVGSGPSGLACAGDLAMLGYQVTVYEALHRPGGVLVYGIPEFRLPKAIVEKETDSLREMGVEFICDAIIGKSLTVDELLNECGYEAVFIGSGAGLPRFMNIEGENLNGVFSANEFLTRINLMKAWQPGSDTPVHHGKKIVVVGGGNVAMDAARCAKRLGGEVTIVYRRTEKELPARKEEVEHAKEEGIVFRMLNNPLRINGKDGWVSSVTCQEMELGEPDASGRRSPVPKEGVLNELEADTVIMAIGTSPNPLIRSTSPALTADRHGCLVADENGKTVMERVWAGGDAVTGAATVILAMGAGRKAARSIHEYIRSR